jgi:8-amino-7-oxononanoate synthase
LSELFAHHHLLDAVIEEVDGRRIRVGDRWLIDFASCNYLGLDLDREVIEAVPAYLNRWGTHPSWSRMLGSPALYRQIETRLTELLGAADALLPTLTHIHASVIPVLASDGTIFVDARAHKTIWDGCLEQGIHVTLAFYPGVPHEEVGFRIQVTAANTDEQVGELLAALDRLADVVALRPI